MIFSGHNRLQVVVNCDEVTAYCAERQAALALRPPWWRQHDGYGASRSIADVLNVACCRPFVPVCMLVWCVHRMIGVGA